MDGCNHLDGFLAKVLSWRPLIQSATAQFSSKSNLLPQKKVHIV